MVLSWYVYCDGCHNLLSAGITTPDNGRMELFVNGQSKVLARYPNVNTTSTYWQWNNIVSVQLVMLYLCLSRSQLSMACRVLS